MKMLMQKSLVPALFASCLLFGGCTVQQGTKVETSDVSFVKKGQTTKAELINKLGPPTTSTVDAAGKETLIWEYYKHTTDGKSFIPFAGLFIGSTEMQGSTFTVLLDKSNRVANYQVSSSRSEGQLGR